MTSETNWSSFRNKIKKTAKQLIRLNVLRSDVLWLSVLRPNDRIPLVVHWSHYGQRPRVLRQRDERQLRHEEC